VTYKPCPTHRWTPTNSRPSRGKDAIYTNTTKSLKMVGAIGFEPTTYGSQNRRATRLRYAPTTDALPWLATGGKRKRHFMHLSFLIS
jgi:hypothetical protein